MSLIPLKKTLAFTLALVFLSACSATPQAKRVSAKPKPFVTPWEYYQKSRPAVFTEEDEVRIRKTGVHSTGEETSSDRSQAVIIGVLVGVVVVGGAVAGILIAK